jgi:hypothetical protein
LLSNKDYIRHSLELNLFFLRLVKEHTIFAAASLPPKDLRLSAQIVLMKNKFEDLLSRTIALSNGVVSHEVLASEELVTDNTLKAEEKTQMLTGIPINSALTQRELALTPGPRFEPTDALVTKVSNLNQRILTEATAAVAFKKKLLNDILNCRAFSFIYPLMLDHVIREGEFYVMMLTKLEKREPSTTIKDIIELELNWNRIMGEHSKFIRGYLDPSEAQLFEMADSFSKEFDKLLAETTKLTGQPTLLPQVTKNSLNSVIRLKNFKKAGSEGILACKIKSVILPLLADHVTREANHYLRLLRFFSTIHLV